LRRIARFPMNNPPISLFLARDADPLGARSHQQRLSGAGAMSNRLRRARSNRVDRGAGSPFDRALPGRTFAGKVLPLCKAGFSVAATDRPAGALLHFYRSDRQEFAERGL
jgi:hypothetical protein